MKLLSHKPFWVQILVVFAVAFILVQSLPGWRRFYVLSRTRMVPDPPGAMFNSLRDRLKGVAEAGYIDLEGSQGGTDTRFWSLYQQAQFVFAPTRLEVAEAFSQEYVVLVFLNRDSLKGFLIKYKFEVLGIFEGVAVLKQGGTS